MAEKISNSTFEIKRTLAKKRKLGEETCEVTPTTINMERIHISRPPTEIVLSEQQFQMTSGQHMQVKNAEIIPQEELTLDIPVLDQYVHVLAEQQKAWRLQDCFLVFLSDFEFINGEVLLTKKRVLIETDRMTCLFCHRNSCMHYKAYEMCLEFQTLNIAESKNHADGTYFTLGANTIFLIKGGYHCFYQKERKWYCDNCAGLCKQKSTLQKILSQFVEDIPAIPKLLDYSTVSTQAILFNLSDTMTTIYSEQLTKGLALPMALKPGISYCKEGYGYRDLALANPNKGIIVYTENDVLDLKEHRVYTSTCEGNCKCTSVFEGDEYLLLNVNNHYFIHYGVLFEYSEFMTMSRNTLHGYMRAKNNKFARMGRKLKFSYHILQHGWNGYLRMLNINYKSSFVCPICKEFPETLVLDGITMGTVKHLPDQAQEYLENQRCTLIPISERFYIPDIKTRKNIKYYSANGMSESTFHTMLQSLEYKELKDYILYANDCIDQVNSVSSKFPNAKAIIELLSRAEPISGLFPISILSENEMKAIIQLSHGSPIDMCILFEILGKMYMLKIFINSFCEVLDGQPIMNFILQPLLVGLLRTILLKIEALNNYRASRIIVEAASIDDTNQYFPAITRRFRLPMYEDEKEDLIQGCTKVYPKHQRLSPGLVVAVCKHKICYGFQILRKKESTITVFNLLLTLFEKPPRTIIYDNACNLHNTCIIRDPNLFKHTTFLVDRFHWKNHSCNSSYSLNCVHNEDYKAINSQVCEQLFSTLRRITTQVSYMRIENLFYNVRYFLYCLNQRELQKF